MWEESIEDNSNVWTCVWCTYRVGRIAGEQTETQNGKDDHEEKQQQENINEGWKRLKYLTQVSEER